MSYVTGQKNSVKRGLSYKLCRIRYSTMQKSKQDSSSRKTSNVEFALPMLLEDASFDSNEDEQDKEEIFNLSGMICVLCCMNTFWCSKKLVCKEKLAFHLQNERLLSMICFEIITDHVKCAFAYCIFVGLRGGQVSVESHMGDGSVQDAEIQIHIIQQKRKSYSVEQLFKCKMRLMNNSSMLHELQYVRMSAKEFVIQVHDPFRCMSFASAPCYCGRIMKIGFCLELDNDRSCMSESTKLLSCGEHLCEQKCHPGYYVPCSNVLHSSSACRRCGSLSPHGDPRFLYICGKKCVPLSKALSRSCLYDHLPGFCGYICNKKLDCDGLRLAFHAWKCNRRCKYILDCEKHQCRKKCCTELRHECLAVCTRLLSCGMHSCNRPSHPGRCYSCELELVFHCGEQSGVCGRSGMKPNCLQFENMKKNDAFTSALRIKCFNVGQLGLSYSRRLIIFCERRERFVSSVEQAFMQFLDELQSQFDETMVSLSDDDFPQLKQLVCNCVSYT
ncbi:Protein shuttle craft, partial [Trichinella papuae]